MPRFDYTTQARSFALRYPLLTHVGIQINFWTIGYVLLVTVMQFTYASMIVTYQLNIPIVYAPSFLTGVILGVSYGSILGLVDYSMDYRRTSRISLGRSLLIRSIIYVLVFMTMMVSLRYLIWEGIIRKFFQNAATLPLTDDTWMYIFYIFSIYTLVLAAGIGFVNQMNKKFGPGVLIPMLLGRFRRPIEQERLFMIMDMQSSTTIAEKLGHRTYSLLVQDCFLDINEVLARYEGEIYQYVGDEVVVSWLKTEKLQDDICLNFFYGTQQYFLERKEYYQQAYGLTPTFKAGAHRGLVMAVEIGDIKREIAYHGDTINTTARIQSVCNEYNQLLLVSETIATSVSSESGYRFHLEGNVKLKGKASPTPIFSVNREEE